MRRRDCLIWPVVLIASSYRTAAQPQPRPLRIGYLATGARGENDAVFREGMRALGYVEGSNLDRKSTRLNSSH